MGSVKERILAEGREWDLASVHVAQVLLRQRRDDGDEKMMSTVLATEVGRLLSLEADEIAGGSDVTLLSLAVVATCLRYGTTMTPCILHTNISIAKPRWLD